jgi:predicted TPR repeat methyltransferase
VARASRSPDRGFALTGIDAAPAMIAICRERFPQAAWRVADMRSLDLGRRFDAIVAWDSYFHLDRDAQRAMFPVFARHIAPGGALLFTSGPAEGEAIGDLYGNALFQASLGPDEYWSLLAASGFGVLLHRAEDPSCGSHTVWLAQAA